MINHAPGSNQPGDYPVSWCKKYGQGNVFYTSLGHEDAVWESNDFQLHLFGGIKWALGLEKGDATPQAPGAEKP
jgi:type 1 glutamine amidotransferase